LPGKLLFIQLAVVPRPTQPSVPPGLVNEASFGWEGKGVWFIPFVDKRMGVQLKL